MLDLYHLLIAIPMIGLIGLITLPASFANRTALRLRNGLVWLTGLQLVGAILASIVLWMRAGSASVGTGLLAPVLYHDGVSALMIVLVSFVGWVISIYSVRYLDGDANQGRYCRDVGVAVGMVSLMVLSGNLLVTIVAWMGMSLGLHRLLLHDPSRVGAVRAARTKFVISRLGDVGLIGAAVLLFQQFGTLNFSEMFAAASVLSESGTVSPAIHFAAFGLMIGAITKSAQFPMHIWLPNTLETPTPVSALMHAGIVNAGGYLMIRMGPIMSLSPGVLMTLAIIGGTTACYAALVMLTQTSVKKSLAYSTVAQMGFMMLQCGLGAYSAAMLHILAHSLYKAHAFLSSGSVMTKAASVRGVTPARARVEGWKTSLVLITCASLVIVALSLFGINPLTKPGGLLLGGLLAIALADFLIRLIAAGDQRHLLKGFGIAAGLSAIYAATFTAVDAAVPTPEQSIVSVTSISIAIVMLSAFAALFLLQQKIAATSAGFLATTPRMRAWFVHASNGFYIEAILRRWFAGLAST